MVRCSGRVARAGCFLGAFVTVVGVLLALAALSHPDWLDAFRACQGSGHVKAAQDSAAGALVGARAAGEMFEANFFDAEHAETTLLWVALMTVSVLVSAMPWNRGVSWRRRFARDFGDLDWAHPHRWFVLKDGIFMWQLASFLTTIAGLYFGAAQLTARVAWFHNVSELLILFQMVAAPTRALFSCSVRAAASPKGEDAAAAANARRVLLFALLLVYGAFEFYHVSGLSGADIVHSYKALAVIGGVIDLVNFAVSFLALLTVEPRGETVEAKRESAIGRGLPRTVAARALLCAGFAAHLIYVVYSFANCFDAPHPRLLAVFLNTLTIVLFAVYMFVDDAAGHQWATFRTRGLRGAAGEDADAYVLCEEGRAPRSHVAGAAGDWNEEEEEDDDDDDATEESDDRGRAGARQRGARRPSVGGRG